MTTRSPTIVKYEYVAEYRTAGGWVPLPVQSIDPVVDKDRVPYTSARLTLAPIDEATSNALEPRALNPHEGGQVRWRITQLDAAGNILGRLPRVDESDDTFAVMHVRSMSRRLDSVTLDLHGREKLLDDLIRLSPDPTILRTIGQGTSTLAAQAETMLLWTLGGGTVDGATPEITDKINASVVFPRIAEVQQGQSYFAALETELSSIGLRLIDLWGCAWKITDRDVPPTYPDAPDTIKLASHDDGPTDADPIITGLNEEFTRDGEWADAIYIAGDEIAEGYVNRWKYTAHPGTYSKGRVIDIGTQSPTSNLAEQILSRTVRKGRDLTITARARFDVLPGMSIEAHLKEITLTAIIKSVSWRLSAGEMTIHAESAITDLDAVTDASFEEGARTEQRILADANAYAQRIQPQPVGLADILNEARWTL